MQYCGQYHMLYKQNKPPGVLRHYSYDFYRFESCPQPGGAFCNGANEQLHPQSRKKALLHPQTKVQGATGNFVIM